MLGERPQVSAEEVRELRVLIRDLQERVRVLELRQEPAETGGELTSDRRTSTPPRVPSSTTRLSPARVARSPTSAPSQPTVQPQDREAIVRGIGSWIRDCLAGERRGLSGRERLSQSSRIYLLFRDYHNRLSDPVEIFGRWSEIAPRVSATGYPDRNPHLGDSVFVGLPNLADARLVAQVAGVAWPAGR